MGCLLNLLLLPFEAVFELIVGGWFSLMQWIVPNKFISKGFEIALRIIVGVFSLAVLVVLILGLLSALFTDATILDLWKFIFIPLGICVVQILLGIIVRCTTNKKS